MINVTKPEWDDLVGKLNRKYIKLKKFIENIEEWKNEDYFAGSVAIITHCAFHLGIIRRLKDFN